jgi:hypothetical protein
MRTHISNPNDSRFLSEENRSWPKSASAMRDGSFLEAMWFKCEGGAATKPAGALACAMYAGLVGERKEGGRLERRHDSSGAK